MLAVKVGTAECDTISQSRRKSIKERICYEPKGPDKVDSSTITYCARDCYKKDNFNRLCKIKVGPYPDPWEDLESRTLNPKLYYCWVVSRIP